MSDKSIPDLVEEVCQFRYEIFIEGNSELVKN